MSLRTGAGADLARQAQLQSRRQLLMAQRLLIKATTQDGASDTANRLDTELGKEAEELKTELKDERSEPWEPSGAVKQRLFRPRADMLELSGAK